MNNEFLKNEPVKKLLLKLSLPAIAAQIINMLYNMVDRIYIGHIEGIGDMALTGVGVCFPIIMIVTAFASLVSMGGAPRASVFMGKGESENAEKTMGNCFILIILIAAVLTAVLLLFNEKLLLLFGASKNTIGYGVDYLSIYAIGTLFVQLSIGMNAFITAQGFAKTSMFTVLIGAVINIALDPLFIFVFDMGVMGAAIATVISQAVSAVWVIAFLLGKKTILKLRLKNFALNFKVFLPCLALGFAPFMMSASESVIMICYNSSLLKYGGDIAVGAMTILSSVMQMTMLPLVGLGQGAQPISSFNFGAKNPERVKEVFKELLKWCLGYAVIVWLIIQLFPSIFASIFSDKKELVDYTAWAIRIFMADSFLMAIQRACQNTLVSIGKAGASTINAIVRKFVCILPLIYILPMIITENKAMAVYLAEPIADFFAVSCTAILFFFQFRKAIKKISE